MTQSWLLEERTTNAEKSPNNDKQNPASFGVFENVLEAVSTALKKELEQDFRMNWSDAMNPVTAGHSFCFCY
jgi:hypothetical protein